MVSASSLGKKLREEDKLKHFWVCLCLQVFILSWLSVLLSIALVLLIGTLKEGWDQLYGSGFCWYDMLANVLGITVGLAVFQLVRSVWSA